MRKLAALVFVLVFSLLLFTNKSYAQQENTQTPQLQSDLNSLPGTNSVFIKLPDNQVVSQNGDQRQPAYSTIKLWVAGAVMQASGNGSLDLSESYTVKASDKVGGTGFVTTGLINTFNQYLENMLVYSDNTATNILIDKIGGLDAVNEYIQANGYENTVMNRYLAKGGPENLTSAKDAVNFMEKLYGGQVVSSQASETITNILKKRTQLKKDSIFIGRNLPADAQFAGKSGVGPGIRNDAGTFLNVAGGRVFMAVLTSSLSSEAAGETAIAQLAQKAQAQGIPGSPRAGNTISTSQSASTGNKSNRVCTKVGNPDGPNPCETGTEIPVGEGVVNQVLEWASQITSNLQQGLWGYFNKLVTSLTSGSFSTGTWTGANEGSVYWCTYLIIDAYNLSGYGGLSKSAHAAVVNMRRWWSTTGVANGYIYIDYPSNNQLLSSVKPGYAMFMEQEAGVFRQREHVNLIRDISIDSEGNGSFTTYDSNTSSVTRKYAVAGWRILNPIYPVRGFGGI